MRGNAFIAILIIAIALVAAPYVGVSIANEDYTPVLILFSILIAVTVARHGIIAFSLMMATMSSALILPLPGRPYWWEFAALLGFSGIGSGLVFGTAQPRWGHDVLRYKWILLTSMAYAALMVMLMRVHGVGLGSLGSDTAGGRFYIQQIILVSLPICAIMFGGRPKLLVKLAVAQFLLAGTFLVSDFFFNYWNQFSPVVLQFFELSSDTLNFMAQYEAGGFRRWQSLSRFGSGLVMVLMIAVPLRHFTSIRAVFLLPVLLALLAMTTLGGHRSSIIEIGAVAGVVAVTQRLTHFRYLAGAIIFVVGTVALLYLLAPRLPDAGQRAISFLPGIDVRYEVKQDAEKTMITRQVLRKRAVKLIDQYFWDGRGFGVDLDLANYARLRQDAITYHEIMGRFYSGPIGIFVSCGVFGFALFMIFLLTATWRCLKLIGALRRSGKITAFHRVAGVFCGKFVWAAFSYCFITGDANTAMKLFLPLISVIIACDIGLRAEARARAAAAERAKSRGERRKIIPGRPIPAIS